MLFNSGVFLRAFLPVVLLLALSAQRFYPRALPWVLIGASLFFYGWWNPSYLLVFMCSASLNFILSRGIYRLESSTLLTFGIAANLVFLGYFKYLGWLLHEAGIGWQPAANIILPLAISFYTFEQISYLVDCRKKIIAPATLRDYLYFVTFFPKLIAGPIVRFAELGKQINNTRITAESFATGITLFIIGLMKKVVLADQAALYVSPVFDAAKAGHVPSLADSWLASLAYTFQIYFDFSGYSDMAIGLALIFGIRLPINFYSPYKSTSIIDFWRHWHMTLSRFLRDYLYFPLGGSRRGELRRYENLILVMAIGGLWHGAGLTFIIWGLLHGIYLAINHLYRSHYGQPYKKTWSSSTASWLVTFLAVVMAWVFFRAPDVETAGRIIWGMLGQGSRDLLIGSAMFPYALVTALLAVALLLPNSNQFIGLDRLRQETATDILIPRDARQSRIHWNPEPTWAIIMGLLMFAHLVTTSKASPFLYFQF